MTEKELEMWMSALDVEDWMLHAWHEYNHGNEPLPEDYIERLEYCIIHPRAVNDSFSWCLTPQGDKFWENYSFGRKHQLEGTVILEDVIIALGGKDDDSQLSDWV
jgi:hypothetical protein